LGVLLGGQQAAVIQVCCPNCESIMPIRNLARAKIGDISKIFAAEAAEGEFG
jgi:hypothetical protein